MIKSSPNNINAKPETELYTVGGMFIAKTEHFDESYTTTQTKMNQLRTKLNSLKDDRMMKYFGSDGMLHIMSQIIENIKTKSDIKGTDLGNKYKTFDFYGKLLVNSVNYIFPDNICIPNEIFTTLLKSSESLMYDISKMKISLDSNINGIYNQAKGIIRELKILEKKINTTAEKIFRLSKTDLVFFNVSADAFISPMSA